MLKSKLNYFKCLECLTAFTSPEKKIHKCACGGVEGHATPNGGAEPQDGTYRGALKPM